MPQQQQHFRVGVGTPPRQCRHAASRDSDRLQQLRLQVDPRCQWGEARQAAWSATSVARSALRLHYTGRVALIMESNHREEGGQAVLKHSSSRRPGPGLGHGYHAQLSPATRYLVAYPCISGCIEGYCGRPGCHRRKGRRRQSLRARSAGSCDASMKIATVFVGTVVPKRW